MNTKSETKIESSELSGKTPQLEETSVAEVKELVQQFRVCWSVWPEECYVQGERRKTGFAIELYGTHEPGTTHVNPGCEHCRPVHAALKEIATYILPHEERPSMHMISTDGQSLSYSAAHRNRPDVTTTIQITHRGIFDRPVDECEIRCLQEMEQALKDLGACKGQWTPRPSGSSKI